MNRRKLLISATSTMALWAMPSLALAQKPQVYTGIEPGVGAGGYDVVSYNTGTPQMGIPTFTTDFNGASWHFASAENLKAFQANPEKFAPAYGGYCAFAVAQGATAKGDPTLWRIVDGRLYFNLNKSAQSRWLQDIPGYITSANANWPKVLE